MKIKFAKKEIILQNPLKEAIKADGLALTIFFLSAMVGAAVTSGICFFYEAYTVATVFLIFAVGFAAYWVYENGVSVFYD